MESKKQVVCGTSHTAQTLNNTRSHKHTEYIAHHLCTFLHLTLSRSCLHAPLHGVYNRYSKLPVCIDHQLLEKIRIKRLRSVRKSFNFSVCSRWHMHDLSVNMPNTFFPLYVICLIIGSAEALPIILCVRYIWWEREKERERERYRERREWRHQCRAKIGDEFTLTLAKNSHNWRCAYTFPCQKFALFVSPFTFPVSPFTERPRGHHCGAEIRNEFTLSIAKNFFRPLCSPSFKWHEPRDEWSKTQDKWSNPAQSYCVLPIEKNESN